VTTVHWDAIVIGAGPAGSVTARELARRGVRTLLVDKAPFPRAKVCGGCVNGSALASLGAVGLGHVPEAIGGVPLNGVTLAAGGRQAKVSLPGGVAVSREAFDVALIDEAIRAGVTFRSPVKAELGEVEGDGRHVFLNDSATFAKVVIVASGLNGRVDHSESTALPGSRIGAGIVLPEAPAAYAAGRIHMATAAGGYVGLVRVENDRLDVAAAFDAAFVRERGGLGHAADTVILAAGFDAVPDLADANWKGTPALTRRPSRVAGPRWFAVGDAAGYVEPFTGEGMAWAIAGAVAVAPLAARGVDEWSDELTRIWTRTHARLVGRRQWSCRILSRLLRSPRAFRAVVAGLSFVPALAGPVVRGLNRPSRVSGVSL
jgi:flavin-dependent dehydrogenase